MTNWMTAPVPRSSFVETVETPSDSEFRQLQQTTNDRPMPPAPPVHDDPESWREAYEERAAIREFSGEYPRSRAEVLAFRDMVNQWHVQHAKPIQGECAGCRKRILSENNAEILADGAQVHPDCIRAYGLRWLHTASEALHKFGIPIPEGWEI